MKNILVLSSVIAGSSLLMGITDVRHSPEKTSVTKNLSSTKRTSAKPVGNISIIIDKSDYELSVYDEKGWYATFPVVFGNNSLGDKKVEGDKNTPEGEFRITNKRVHEKWCRFMGIDYPTAEDREKFEQRKKRGEIPANAKIGGSIGIHGTWPHEDYVIDRFKNWTLGCISMKNDDVKEIYGYTQSGVKVTIRK